MTKKQATMFSSEDLPLFSGTVPTVTVKSSKPAPKATQATFAACRVCLDTGKVGDKFCTCQAGQDARQKESKS